MRVSLLVLQGLDILLHGCATVEDGGLDFWKVLAEPGIFVLDLVREFAGVAHDQDRAFAGDRLDLLQCGEHEDCGFTETGFGLTEHVGSKDGLRDAHLLDCRKADIELDFAPREII